MDPELRTVGPDPCQPLTQRVPSQIAVLGREAGVAVEQQHHPRRRRPRGRVDRAPGAELAPQPLEQPLLALAFGRADHGADVRQSVQRRQLAGAEVDRVDVQL